MLPPFEPAKRGNSNSVLKTQQSLHSQKLRTIVVQKYHLRVSSVIFDAPCISYYGVGNNWDFLGETRVRRGRDTGENFHKIWQRNCLF